MTRLVGAQRVEIPGYIGGLIESADVLPKTAITAGENFVPEPAGRMVTRGGSRIMLTLKDDQGTPAEVSHVPLIVPITPPGVLAISFADAVDKHFVTSLTALIAFSSGTESTSRTALPASWNNTESASAYGTRPVGAVLFEKLYVSDARTLYSSRKTLLQIEGQVPPVVTEPSFDLGGGSRVLKPYCLAEYNGVLFIAGYDGRGLAAADDESAILRHSFLGTAPAAANGFDPNAWNIIGAKGERITALRKGRGLLLVAKLNEFYRITGAGRALPGWQYVLEPVDNTPGMGVENPHGLTFANGYWYGIGRQGPFRTDGFNVESLAGPRQRGWAAISAPERSWCDYHAARRLVLFGLQETEAGGTFPNLLWAWETDREVWAPNARVTTRRFFMGTSLVSGIASDAGGAGPSAPPSAPNNTSITTSGWTANWTNGDATAETEYWEKQTAGGTYVLEAVIAAGTATLARTGRTTRTEYFWKVRHRKNGVSTAYTADQSAKTLIAPPSLANGGCTETPTIGLLIFTQNVGGTTLRIERSPAGAGTWSLEVEFVNQGAGTFDYNPVVSVATDFRARSSDTAWSPPDSAFSGTAAVGPC